jgi:hypothetical protein
MFCRSHLDVYLTQPGFNPSLYKSMEVRGARPELDADDGLKVCGCQVDDANPQFYSAYLRDLEGLAVCVADAGMDRLDELRGVAKGLAAQHGWAYQDFTLKKHNVHIYAIARVTAPDIEAQTHADTQKCGCKCH